MKITKKIIGVLGCVLMFAVGGAPGEEPDDSGTGGGL